jgi:hypothetical protein
VAATFGDSAEVRHHHQAESHETAGKVSPAERLSRATPINNFVDVGPPGPSPGDIYVFRDELFSHEDPSRKVGEALGRCNLIDPVSGRFECTIVSSFAHGTITTDGVLVNVPGVVSVGSITGGTGAFRGVRGEAHVDLGPPEGPHVVTFILHP